jgi:hypothetical protein
LIRQISESISNYSLEKAHEDAGVATPKRDGGSRLVTPAASQSSSALSSP